MKLRDLLEQAVGSLLGRPTRSLLTLLGVAVGVCALVAVTAMSASAGTQISGEFDLTEASSVVVISVRAEDPYQALGEVREDVAALNGVVAAATSTVLEQDVVSVRTAPCRLPRPCPLGATAQASLLQVGPGFLAARDAQLLAGRSLDVPAATDSTRPECLVDRVVAERLGFSAGVVALTPLVDVEGRGCLVVGVYEAPTGDSAITAAILVGDADASGLSPDGVWTKPELVVLTRPGASAQVAREIPFAADPRAPDAYLALVGPSASGLRGSVLGELRSMILGLTAVALFVAAIGVATTISTSVFERRAEIGLRRALGADRATVALQFVAEAAVLGLAGGVEGTAVGVLLASVVSLVKGWLLTFSPLLILGAPLIGVLVGVLAGIQPSLRAARVSPADAVRGL